MKVEIKRTGRKVELLAIEKTCYAGDVPEQHGYIGVLDSSIQNFMDISWEGIEFNRLYSKGGILYRFNHWLGTYPYNGIELEEIGEIIEEE